MTHTKDLDGQVALITGAARNMGRAFALALAARGADIAVHYNSDRSASDAAETVAAIEAQGRTAIAIQGDLTRHDQVQSLIDKTMEQFGHLDIVINNAGMVLKKPVSDVAEAEFDAIFGINAKAPFFVMQSAAKHLSDGGRIINIGTSLMAATTGNYSVYAASKSALEHFTRALAKEIGHRGITVNTIAPGPIDTPFFHGEENEASTAYLKQASPLNRLGEVTDIVPVIDFIASEQSRWINGQTVFVNGAFVAR